MKAIEARLPLQMRSTSSAMESRLHPPVKPNFVLLAILLGIAVSLGAQEIPGDVALVSFEIDLSGQCRPEGDGLSPQTEHLLQAWSNVRGRREQLVENVDLTKGPLLLTVQVKVHTAAETVDVATARSEPFNAEVGVREEAGPSSKADLPVAAASTTGSRNRLLLFLLIGAVPVLTGVVTHRLIKLHRVEAKAGAAALLCRVVGRLRQSVTRYWTILSNHLFPVSPGIMAAYGVAADHRTMDRQDEKTAPWDHRDLLHYLIEDNAELRRAAG